MQWPLLLLLTVSASPEPPGAPESLPVSKQEQGLSEEVEDAHRGLRGLKNDMLGLELFLRDKKEHKELCPEIEWAQPSLEEYKKEPKSHLPEDCKKEE